MMDPILVNTLLTVALRPGIAARLFRALADRSINVDMIEQNVSQAGTTDISFTVPHADLATAEEVSRSLQPELAAREVTADHDIATVSMIGAGMKTHPGVSATNAVQSATTRARNSVNDPANSST